MAGYQLEGPKAARMYEVILPKKLGYFGKVQEVLEDLFDEEAILDSVEATGRLVVVDESPPRCSLAADIAALVTTKAFTSLTAPPELVTGPHSPIPFARELERAWVPSPQKIEAAVRRALAFR